jgi:hypothetical protein
MTCNIRAFSNAFTVNAKGGTLTRERASSTWNALARFAKERRMILHPEKMTSKQLMQFVLYRQEQGISSRSIQNEVSHIRRALVGAGRDIGDLKDPKNYFSSARLKVPKGSRIGAKPPAPKDALASLKTERADVRAALALQAALGLRMAEAIESASSLAGWANELSEARELGRGAFLPVTEGTKGGRPRYVLVRAENLDTVRDAVTRAYALVKGDDLVQSASLESARRLLARACLDAGFQSHGLRRDWAVRQFLAYRADGKPEKEALRLLSRDLGHGDGRGRWCWNNYLKGAFNG